MRRAAEGIDPIFALAKNRKIPIYDVIFVTEQKRRGFYNGKH